MSSWSEITFRGKEFYAWKSILEVWMVKVIQEIDKIKNQSTWLQEMRHSWEGYLAGADLDYFPLDEDIEDTESLTLMLSLCEAALQHLEDIGDTMSKDELNIMMPPNRGLFQEDLPTIAFKETGRYFIKLLKGELGPGPNDSRIFEDA